LCFVGGGGEVMIKSTATYYVVFANEYYVLFLRPMRWCLSVAAAANQREVLENHKNVGIRAERGSQTRRRRRWPREWCSYVSLLLEKRRSKCGCTSSANTPSWNTRASVLCGLYI